MIKYKECSHCGGTTVENKRWFRDSTSFCYMCGKFFLYNRKGAVVETRGGFGVFKMYSTSFDMDWSDSITEENARQVLESCPTPELLKQRGQMERIDSATIGNFVEYITLFVDGKVYELYGDCPSRFLQ